MPYIKKYDREEEHIDTPGKLNYLISVLLICYLKTNGLSYSSINDILGALEGSKLEFVERVMKPYETKKKEENGDIGYEILCL